ncbi:MAG TPA: RNA polymerase sigma factor [Steroidobacteraceae bacterium]|nr:RNA polymerase sigma factor [Steroidobacteraceae bacterium]
MGSLQRQSIAEPSACDEEPVSLIGAAVAGDLVAFEALYRRFAPRIHGLCLRLTGQRESAEDCTQETFVAAWRALARFEQRSRFSTWLQRIAIRTVLARRRGLRVVRELSEPAGGLPETADAASEAPPLDLERAILRLPEGARHVLVLVALYGYSHAQAAEMLGLAEGTCKAQLHRARALLSAALDLEDP